MERLTKWYDEGTAILDVNAPNVRNATEKLASYEDTDLTPEQITELERMYEEKCIEVAELKKQVPFGSPCSIGSDAYFIPSKVNYDLNILNGHEENNRVYHQKVAKIVFTERGWYLECDKDLEYGTDHILVDKLYKETWFLTQVEAEEALKRYKN